MAMIGEILVSKGYITQQQLDGVLAVKGDIVELQGDVKNLNRSIKSVNKLIETHEVDFHGDPLAKFKN